MKQISQTSILEISVDVKEDSLPKGLSLDTKTSLITGAPTGEPGEYQIKVTVKTVLVDVEGVRRVILE